MRTALTMTAAVLAAMDMAQGAEKGLLGHWRLDEGVGTQVREASGRGKDGCIINRGRGVNWVPGRTGRALEFLGGDPAKRNVAGCVQIPNMADHDFANGVTIELWVKFTAIDRPQTYELISNTFGDRGKGFRLVLSWLQLGFRSGEGGSGKAWGAASRPAETKVETGVWYHIAATYDGSVYRVYLDGEEVAASKPGLTLTKGRPSLCIGSYNGGYAYGLNGIVDDVRLYSYPRRALEILDDAKFGF